MCSAQDGTFMKLEIGGSDTAILGPLQLSLRSNKDTAPAQF